ncbi:MAG: nitroreductase family protein, partial [Clostridiales bacterium]|nr:nitroreductase family protein [Clostridiales bacterium]
FDYFIDDFILLFGTLFLKYLKPWRKSAAFVFVLLQIKTVNEVNEMILDLLKKRCSVRAFTDTAIPDPIIDYILECGRLSPSGGNEQPWKFGVITNKVLIERIADMTYYNKAWIIKAPLLIVLCTQLFPGGGKGTMSSERFPSLANEIDKADEKLHVYLDMEEHQTKIPGTHMVLAAMEHGIGSTWISYLNCEGVSCILGMDGYIASQILAFGYPAGEMVPIPKKKLEDIVFYNYYKQEDI